MIYFTSCFGVMINLTFSSVMNADPHDRSTVASVIDVLPALTITVAGWSVLRESCNYGQPRLPSVERSLAANLFG